MMQNTHRWAACFLSALFVLVSVHVRSAEAGVILQSATYGGSSYHLVAESVAGQRITWNNAEAFAVTLGGHLVTVNDAAENSFLLTTFQASAIAAKASGHPSGGLLSLWIGYNDAVSEGNFDWVGGGGTGFTNWAFGQPGGGFPDEDVAAMLVTSTLGPPGRWHDVVSDFRFNDVTYGLVEVPIGTAIPEPASAALATALAISLAGWGWRRRNVRTGVRQIGPAESGCLLLP